MLKSKKKHRTLMDTIDQEKFNTLTPKEKKYFRLMFPQSGVLFLTGAPGIAKSAITRTIAEKLGFNYMDIRLSMVDEIDVGLFPYRKEMEIDLNDPSGEATKQIISVMSYAIPEWAFEANQAPTIIHFEEMNRAPIAVRNAALQLLLERSIGTKFKFNDNVYMVSSGNLGEADGTDVEEFDRALNNRLIHRPHTLSLPEWIDAYAEENVHPIIVGFLKSNENHYLHSLTNEKNSNSSHVAYATPRSWTFLSDYILTNYGADVSVKDFVDDLREMTSSFVGDAASGKFIRYIEESLRFGINDLLNNYDGIQGMLEELTRDKKSDLLNTLKTMDITLFTESQKENVKRFILTVSKDEAVSYILKLLDDDYKQMETNDDANSVAEEFLSDKRFLKFYNAIKSNIDNK